MSCRAVALLVVATACLSGQPATAQDRAHSEAPAHISLVDGTAVLERDGQIDRAPLSMPLLAGDRVRTEAGRVEVLFADGSALHLDAGTVVDFQSDEVVRLLQGRIRLSIAGPARDVFYRIDAPSAWIEIHEVGEYRVAVLRDADVELAVLRGSAELVNEQGRSQIRAGERTFAQAGAAPSPPYVFNSAAWDAFDQWSEGRRAQRLGASAQYLPSDVRPYASTFDMHGTWRHDPAHGYVWYPRVAAGWRPFYHGRWAHLHPFGWTWIAADPWGWPTHHFGRWGLSAGAWFWIPGRHWGPAWVSWAYAPDFVGWSPLGWDHRPLLQINIGIGRLSPFHVWTVVPRRHFSARFVHVPSVRIVRIDQRIQHTFIIRDRAPETRFAVGRRDTAPIRTAGRFAVPRSGTGTASASRAGEGGRRLTSPGGAAGDGQRRFPAPARAPGSVSSSQRAGTSSAPASTAGRAVTREQATGGAPGVSSRTARSTQPAQRATAPEQVAPDGSARRVAPTRPSERSTVTTPPAGAVRAVPRTGSSSDRAPAATAPTRSRSSSAAPAAPATAAPSTAATPAPARPTRTRSSSAAPPAPASAAPATAAPPAAARPARPRSSSAAPAAPATAAPATAATPAPARPVRPRSYSAAPVNPSTPARASTPPAGAARPGGATRSGPSYRSGSAAGSTQGRATPRSGAAPAAPTYRAAPARQAPAASAPPTYRAAPARQAPAASAPPASSASPRPAGRSTPTAGAGSRTRSTEASSSGRARRRE